MLCGESLVAFADNGKKFLYAAEVVVGGGEIAPYFAAYDDLRGHVSAGLEEDGIHVDGRKNTGGFSL